MGGVILGSLQFILIRFHLRIRFRLELANKKKKHQKKENFYFCLVRIVALNDSKNKKQPRAFLDVFI